MRKTSLLFATALLTIGTAACQQSQPQDNIDDTTANIVEPDEAAPTADDGADVNAAAPATNASDNSATPAPTAASIPAQYHGRWGMNAADCDPARADNKGLITVDGKTIKFYESRATLKEQRPAIATSFAGLFAFTGEGQEWTKVETLTRTGDKLKRADDEGSYDYTRCR